MDYSDLTIIIPTLNEQGDIAKLLGKLQRLYKNVNVIVADDGSTDNTKPLVLRMARKNRRVIFFDRSLRRIHGLTASVLEAESTLVKSRYTIVMDADMQHPPEAVRRIYRGLSSGGDLVIGTRTSVKDWELHRKMVSKSITAIATAAFKLKGRRTVKDMMSGFFGIRSGLFKQAIRMNGEKFVPTGYKVLLDILNTIDSDIRITEVPYKTFHKRLHGTSKLHVRQAIDVLHSISK